MKRAQKAGILCNEGAFWKFLGVNGKEAAARTLRRRCEIASRSDLDKDLEAGKIFDKIAADYQLWMYEP